MGSCVTETGGSLQDRRDPSAADAKAAAESPEHLICGSGARILSIAWLFCLFTPAMDGPGGPLPPEEGLCLRLAFLAAVIVAYLAQRVFLRAAPNERRLRVLGIAGLVLPPLVAIGTLLVLPFPALVLLWCTAGGGYACLSVLGLSFSCTLKHSALIISTSLCFAVSALLACLVVFLMPAEFRLMVVAFMPMVSAVLFIVDGELCQGVLPEVSFEESRERAHMSWKGSAPVIAHSLCSGFATYLIVALSRSGTHAGLLAASICVFVICIVAAVEGAVGSGSLLDEGVQLRFTLPLAMVGMLPLFFFGDAGIIGGCCFLVMVFVLQGITNVNAVAENVRLDRLNVIYVCATARPMNALGLGIGYACGFLMLQVKAAYGDVAALGVVYVMLTVLAALSALLFRNRYPGSVDEGEEGALFDQKSQKAADKHVSWKSRCEAYSASIGLSPRQQDVFFLLARGHNANYIERKLVISKHTVKSHVYSIYQKAQVHSKQELIEQVESFDPEP